MRRAWLERLRKIVFEWTAWPRLKERTPGFLHQALLAIGFPTFFLLMAVQLVVFVVVVVGTFRIVVTLGTAILLAVALLGVVVVLGAPLEDREGAAVGGP